LHLSAGGHAIAWTRDPVDLYAIHLDVPAGVASIDVDFVYLGANDGNYSSARLSTPNLLSLTWNKVLLTPKVADYATQQIAPSLTLPAPIGSMRPRSTHCRTAVPKSRSRPSPRSC